MPSLGLCGKGSGGMEVHGSNKALGAERIELTERRSTLPVVIDEPPFPLGVGGLIPVVTQRKDGSEKTVYAFCLDEGDLDEGDLDEEDLAATAPDIGTAPLTPAVSATTSAANAALLDALSFVNRMLTQAAELSGYPFGTIGGIQVGITPSGWGFTRVDIVERDAHGQPSASPLHLHIETSDEPGAPETLSVLIEYDAAGAPAHLVMTEYDEDDVTFRVDANTNEKSGKFSVRKVERIDRRAQHKSLLYKRGKQYASN